MNGRTLEGDGLTIHIPMRFRCRGGRKLVIVPEGLSAREPAKPARDEVMIKALVKAHRWRRRIDSGRSRSITDLAAQEGVTDAYVFRMLTLTLLASDIVEAILDGRQPRGLKLSELFRHVRPLWEDQRRGIDL